MPSREKLSMEQVQAALTRLPEWSVREGKLHRELVLGTFVDAFGVMVQIALVAERRNHHPEWSNVYNRVTIDLSTHDVGGITEHDIALAEAIDALVAD